MMQPHQTNTFFIKIVFLAIIGTGYGRYSYSQTSQEQQVNNAVNQFREALIKGDTVILSHLTSPILSYGHSNNVTQNKTAFLDAIGSGKSDFVTIELSNQTITISHNTAIVRHVLYATTNDGGNPGNIKLGVLLIWQKEKKVWRLIARQAVKLV